MESGGGADERASAVYAANVVGASGDLTKWTRRVDSMSWSRPEFSATSKKLFVAQGYDGINPDSAACWYVARQKSDRNKQGCDSAER